MKNSLKNFAVVFGTCIVITVVITLFNGRSLPSLINIGSYVGALFLLLGCWRLLNGGNDAIEQAHMIQRVQNFESERQGGHHIHTQVIPMFLSSGTLFTSGLVWLVLLQAVRYAWSIAL